MVKDACIYREWKCNINNCSKFSGQMMYVDSDTKFHSKCQVILKCYNEEVQCNRVFKLNILNSKLKKW
jgi:hypothetical protein